ncbi:MAG: deoxyribodipyrimidine photo-lyase [Pseudomonadota bacterium]|nr:deoxyribodipyrimidine photo-lyase [Pseudomonadota bacterium]QKK05043.1 MAG: deoxyribodipyrimidine photo-lyase [Pseudomonadota bacterium]
MQKHTLLWFRQDLRLADHPALQAALQTECPILPIFILDDDDAETRRIGGAARWWLHESLTALDADLRVRGSRLLCFRGKAGDILQKLCNQYHVESVFWNRSYVPQVQKRDAAVKAALKQHNITAQSFASYLLFEPWQIKTGAGKPYRVFTPFSKACMAAEWTGAGQLFAAPEAVPAPQQFPAGTTIAELDLLPPKDWYKEMAQLWQPGENGAQSSWRGFLNGGIAAYQEQRDFPNTEGVSRLSPHLHWGEIAPARLRVDMAAATEKYPDRQARHYAFLRQVLWREFSYHLLDQLPDMAEKPLNENFTRMKWENDSALLTAWQQGKTGYPLVDAGMRQLWRTGWMHNRVRMIAASFLIKDLFIDWRIGEKYFWDTLLDADPANNAAGWQWVAGCGADAAPYFRIFNPVLQSKKFDAAGGYIRAFVPELANLPDKYLHAPWEAPDNVLEQAGLVLGKDYPYPVVDHAAARDKALAIYKHDIKQETA